MKEKKRIMRVLWIGMLGATLAAMSIFGLPKIDKVDIKNKEIVIAKSDLELGETWADSVFKTMSLEEKVAQLMVVRVRYNDVSNQEYINFIKKYQFGGVCFFKGSPVKQILLTNEIQNVSKIPLMVTFDGEFGPAMRLDSALRFPSQMALGAIQNDELIYEMAAEFAHQFKAMGVHVNFAPVVDVNNNPKNPVINSRSFGENPQLVAQKGLQYVRGLEENGIMSSLKHFPGHGDTETDSHHALPVIKHSLERLAQVEFYPFKYIIDKGVGSVMVGHLFVPAIDTTPNLASSLSPAFTQELLRKYFKYDGLVFTDGMEMNAMTNNRKPGEIEIKAILSDIDLLLLPPDPAVGHKKLVEAVNDGTIPVETIDIKCLKVLREKEKWGIHKSEQVSTDKIYNVLNSPKAKDLHERISNATMTIIKNDNDILPIDFTQNKVASLVIGSGANNTFQKQLSLSGKISSYQLNKTTNAQSGAATINKLKGHDLVVVGVFGLSDNPRNKYGLSAQTLNLLGALSKLENVVLVVFGNPYSLANIQNLNNFNSILVAYHSTAVAQTSAAKAVLGLIDVDGKLPVSVNKDFPSGLGFDVKKK